MRIRKQQSRGSAGGESSGANPDLGSQEHELVQSSRGAKDKPGDEVQMLNSEVVVVVEKGLKEESGGREVIERVDSPSRSAFTWLDKLRYSKGFTEIEPYSNLEDFIITSLLKDGGSSLKERTVSCNDSSMSAPLAQGYQLRSDASLPSAFKHCHGSGIPVHDPRKEALSLESKHEKQERGGQSSKAIRKGYAGTSSEKPMHDEIRSGTTEGPCTDVAHSQLATVEAEFKQGLGSSRHEPWRRDSLLACLAGEKSEHGNFVSCSLTIMQKEKAFPEFLQVALEICAAICLAYAYRSGYDDGERLHGFRFIHQVSNLHSESFFLQKAEPGDTRFGTLLQIDQLQGPSETARRRSHRKWRISSFTDAERSHRPRDDAASAAITTTLENPPPVLSQDHPALQPKDSLVFSLYTVSLRAGKPGLTAREAVSQMLHQGLPGLQEQGAVQSSRRIAKLFRKSPYYMELGEGKFALCSAVTNTGEDAQPQPQPWLQDEPDSGKALELSTADISQKRRQMGEEEDEAQESESRPGRRRSGRPKKLKYMKQENVGELGNQCNRTDGKGWVCPLLAKPGYQLCDHHLDKLRCKPGSRSKKKKRTNNQPEPEPPLDTAGHE